MGPDSQETFFLGQELHLVFAAWINLTSNANNLIVSRFFSSLECAGDLQEYQGFMMPLNHQPGMQDTLKEHFK